MSESITDAPNVRVPLHDLHVALGGKIVAFAGYELPVNYAAGILTEHLLTRQKAGLFDVSHMGQAFLSGPGAAQRLETLVPGDIQALGVGRTRYTQFLNDEGGILDDLMVTRLDATGEKLFLVVNAACKDADFARLRAALPGLRLEVLEDRALLALQGPKAPKVFTKLLPGVCSMEFMSFGEYDWHGTKLYITRSGYTGEDGFEISVPVGQAKTLAEALLADPDVKPIGLGARDSLRLEAGLCLYGHDIDETTSPIEAGLTWSIGKRRRAEGGFPGADRILREFAEGVTRKRVG